MRFLFVVCLGLFCTRMFAQRPSSNQNTPRISLTGLSSAAELTSEDGQVPVADLQNPKSAELADAPSATQESNCTQNTGKCPEWVHRLIGRYPPIDMTERWNRQPDHFFTFGNARRTLHRDKTSWMLFAAAHAGMWAPTVIAVRNHRTSKEEAHSEYPAAAFMTGIDLLVFKTISPSLSVGSAIYATFHYSRAAAK
jgi:hypothetical protein